MFGVRFIFKQRARLLIEEACSYARYSPLSVKDCVFIAIEAQCCAKYALCSTQRSKSHIEGAS